MTPLSKLLTSITLVILLASPTLLKYKIATKLNQICPLYTKLKNNDQENLTKLQAEEFFEYVTSDIEPVGNGSFGEVFVFEASTNLQKTSAEKQAIKLVRLYEDAQTNEGNQQQGMFYEEVGALVMLNGMDPNGLYFPKFNFCIEVTQEFINLESNKQNLDNDEFIIKEDEKVPFLLSTQKLDLELEEFNEKYLRGKIGNFDLTNRMQLAINLLKGVVLMNTEVIICDLKLSNIMLKLISEQKALENQEHDLKVIELNAGEYFQLFIIDYGMATKNEKEKVFRCPGGSPGYLSNEFFDNTKQISHDLVDIHAAGITLLNQELVKMRLENISDVLDFAQTIRYKKKSSFNMKDPNFIKYVIQSEIMKVAIAIMDHDSFAQAFRARVKETIPNIKNIAEQKVPGKKWDTDKPSLFLYCHVQVFEVFMTSALYFFPNHSIFNNDLNNRIKTLSDKIKGYQNLLSGVKVSEAVQPQINKYNEKILDATALINIYTAQKDLKIKYFRYLINLIDSKSKRPEGQEAINEIKLLMKNFKEGYISDLLRLESTSAKTMSEAIKQTANSQPGDYDIEAVIERRKKKFATIYGEPHTQYLRTERMVI